MVTYILYKQNKTRKNRNETHQMTTAERALVYKLYIVKYYCCTN